jgi:ATP synthase protein I
MALDKAPDWLIKTLKVQVIITLTFGIGLFITSAVTGYSVILGGAIYSLPAYWAMRREFNRSNAINDPKRTLVQMYGNQIIKFAFTLLLFTLVFGLVKPLDSLALLLAFIGCQVLAALLPAVIAKQNSVNP